jgi:hypothetical protein
MIFKKLNQTLGSQPNISEIPAGTGTYPGNYYWYTTQNKKGKKVQQVSSEFSESHERNRKM